MSFNLKKLSGGGVIQDAVNRLVDAVQSLKPQSAAGVLTNHTTRGVTRTPLSNGAGTPGDRIEELDFLAEFDDFLKCTNPRTDNLVVYVMKPKTLRASYWNPGWNFAGNPGVSPAGSSTNRGLVYHSPNRRFRIKTAISGTWGGGLGFPGSGIEALRTNDADNPARVINYTYVREIIDPPYFGNDSDGAGNTTWDLQAVYAMPLQSYSIITTNGETAADGSTVAPIGEPIAYIDMNVDGRAWRNFSEWQRREISIEGTLLHASDDRLRRFIQCDDLQKPDQVFGNSSPAFIADGFGPNE